jgi:hypothetical protein
MAIVKLFEVFRKSTQAVYLNGVLVNLHFFIVEFDDVINRLVLRLQQTLGLILKK